MQDWYARAVVLCADYLDMLTIAARHTYNYPRTIRKAILFANFADATCLPEVLYLGPVSLSH